MTMARPIFNNLRLLGVGVTQGKPEGKLLVVVDDLDDQREIIARFLAPDWKIKSFGDPEGALEFVLESGCDGLVVDQRMPGMTGLQLARRLRECGFEKDILLLTHLSDSIPIKHVARDMRIHVYPKSQFQDELRTLAKKIFLSRFIMS